MTNQLMTDLIHLNFEFNKYTVSNSTMRAAYVTQSFNEMLNMMQSTIDLYDAGVTIPE